MPGSYFTIETVPFVLWPDLVAVYGSEYTYHTAEGETVPGLQGILIEGVEDEALSPGRYARFWVDRRDLPREPRSADWLFLGDATYDVERVDATVFDLNRLVIKLTQQNWQS